ncbi:MmcQ/YjbR family DNA-binding protein [Pseudonocardia sp. GCM10023141]|uniref:MmcQ/YjbR family DNA-binding protein n=1 Tax=Pseudonocardia sp. GCM10023141 TaxID=3252653 RepID=UPI00361C608F
MDEPGDVPSAVLAALRAICLGLPEVHEERAWVGVRWMVRRRTFAHVLPVEEGRPQAYARAVGADGPLVVITFRSPAAEIAALVESGPPFFWAGWGRDVIAMVLGDGPGGDPVEWSEVAELLTESYCVLAPKKLVARVDRPDGALA